MCALGYTLGLGWIGWYEASAFTLGSLALALSLAFTKTFTPRGRLDVDFGVWQSLSKLACDSVLLVHPGGHEQLVDGQPWAKMIKPSLFAVGLPETDSVSLVVLHVDLPEEHCKSEHTLELSSTLEVCQVSDAILSFGLGGRVVFILGRGAGL